MIKRKWWLVTLILFFPVLSYAAGRSYGEWDTATDANHKITVGFMPNSYCITNTGSTNALYIDFTDGVAAATSGSTNIKINPNVTQCFNNDDPQANRTFEIGLICAAGLSTTYNFTAYRGR